MHPAVLVGIVKLIDASLGLFTVSRFSNTITKCCHVSRHLGVLIIGVHSTFNSFEIWLSWKIVHSECREGCGQLAIWASLGMFTVFGTFSSLQHHGLVTFTHLACDWDGEKHSAFCNICGLMTLFDSYNFCHYDQFCTTRIIRRKKGGISRPFLVYSHMS